MTPINPPDEFLKHAAECQQMAKTTRNPASKETWNRMAERWLQCAERAKSQSATTRPRMPVRRQSELLRLFIEPDWVLLLLFQPRCGGAFSLGARRKRRKLRGSNRATPWRKSMALDRSKRPPRSGHGRPPFWERPSLALPDPWEPRRGCANYAPLGGAVNANGDRGSSVAPRPVALVLRPGWLQTAARSPLLLQCLVLGGRLRRHRLAQ